MKLRLVAVVGAALLGVSQPAFGQVEVNHQGGQTVYSIAPQSGRPFEISAAYACPGEEACRPAVVRVAFGTYTRKQLRYKDDHAVSFVIDGETQLSIPNSQYAARQAAAAQVFESIVCMVMIDDFLTLAGAEKAEYEIGPEEGELSGKQLKALAALAERVPSPPEQPAEEAGESEPEDPRR